MPNLGDSKAPPAIILAGGMGTRIRDVLGENQKCVSIINGRPFLEWILRWLKIQGITDIFFSVGYKGQMVEEAISPLGNTLGQTFQFVYETKPLGTGGAIRNALNYSNAKRFLVLNGDSFCAFNFQRLQEEQKRTGALATLWLTSVNDSRRFGRVETDPNNCVTSFVEKSETGGPGNINSGIYFFAREVFDLRPENSAFSLERELLPILSQKRSLFGINSVEPFIDIGTPETYKIASEFFSTPRFSGILNEKP